VGGLRALARKRLPPRLRYEISVRRGRSYIRDIDLDALDELARADDLGDPDRLERFLPRLGINDDMPELLPRHLGWAFGKGLLVWQYPCQLAPYLVHIGQRPVRSYLEIGVGHGGSFIATVEYLRRTGHPVERALAADISWVPGVSRYVKTRPYAEQITADSASATFRAVARSREWDVAFIDGDHSYEGCLTDFETVHGYARTIAFHDIVDSLAVDVPRVWERMKREHARTYEFAEFTAQYPDVAGGRTYLGIGVATRRDR
jgi:cephalosporin hydroxylase